MATTKKSVVTYRTPSELVASREIDKGSKGKKRTPTRKYSGVRKPGEMVISKNILYSSTKPLG